MIIPLLTRLRDSRTLHGIPMERFYDYAGISRQGYFQALKSHRREQHIMREVEPLVLNFRKRKDNRAGSRTLYHCLNIKQVYSIGVNKFEGLMRGYGLNLAPLRVRVVTTQSSKQSWNYPDLCKGLEVNWINQLVVGDLTYVSYGKHRFFLFCLTDVYSARIVGYDWSERMRAQDAIRAFDKWVKLRGRSSLKECIHHTDGGSQYFSELYLTAMLNVKLKISVARSCLDNGFAEQRNGLLKHHLIPAMKPDLKGKKLERELSRIMHVYNHERKQENLGWKSPVEFENHWSDKQNRPIMTVYDRDKKTRTKRIGF